jgi:hypothetical protein
MNRYRRQARPRATGWLEQYLRAAGANGISSLALRDTGGLLGHSWTTLQRARAKLGSRIVIRQNPHTPHAGWRWYWNETEPPAADNDGWVFVNGRGWMLGVNAVERPEKITNQ